MCNNHSKYKGFTLLEVMIVVAIIGIIAAFALPNYSKYILRSHRVDARNMLQEVAHKLQQNYSEYRRYDCKSIEKTCPAGKEINDATIKAWGLDRSPASGTLRYNISFKSAPTIADYTLQAVPDGAQKKDDCETFTLNQSNIKIAAGEANSRGTKSRDCWSG